jgi:hypothetical protein
MQQRDPVPDDQVSRRWAEHSRSVFVPWLLAFAFVVWLGFQTYQLLSERQQLKLLRVGQDANLDAANKVRGSLDAVATSTAKLASEGNANARVIVEELRKRGITINPDDAAKPN